MKKLNPFTYTLGVADSEDIKIRVKHVEDDRLVSMEYTAYLVTKIKFWIMTYENILIPETKNLDKLIKLEDHLSRWKKITNKLIPEITREHPRISREYFVYKNYMLLEPNKALTYNQALFILLGLNAHELDYSCYDLPVLDVKPRPSANHTLAYGSIEDILWATHENQELKQSAYVQNGKITSENLKKLAKVNGFFNDNSFVFPESKTKQRKEGEKKAQTRKQIETLRDEILQIHPNLSGNEYLAADIAPLMLKRHGKKLEISTIRTDYLSSRT
jgi:hypothetical protein